jgi:diaminohydroxyphosphoribosylaminopyrimidine deaminase/5-amino-6-(5-phosphoribosylamino)uracil reductase
MQEHNIYMKRCLDLAALGAGKVSPNPMVGCVIVHNNLIIGEGWHQEFGKAHAEVNAINEVLENYPDDSIELLKNSTIYVSLEPCSHQGKTPPCADLIIRHAIPQAVIACRDPFKAVNGRGIERLKDAGISIIEGVLEKEALHLNRRFFTRVEKQRPYIILKWAETANGFFAPNNEKQQWISGKQAQQLVHRWRGEEDAILIGKNTALIDNPQLNTRLYPGKNPKRIVLDRNLELPQSLNVLDNSIETIILNEKETKIEESTKYIALESFDFYLAESICYQLFLFDIQSVIIEGGAKTLNLFIEAELWDEARIFTSNSIWENGLYAPTINQSVNEEIVLGNDILSIYYHL